MARTGKILILFVLGASLLLGLGCSSSANNSVSPGNNNSTSTTSPANSANVTAGTTPVNETSPTNIPGQTTDSTTPANSSTGTQPKSEYKVQFTEITPSIQTVNITGAKYRIFEDSQGQVHLFYQQLKEGDKNYLFLVHQTLKEDGTWSDVEGLRKPNQTINDILLDRNGDICLFDFDNTVLYSDPHVFRYRTFKNGAWQESSQIFTPPNPDVIWFEAQFDSNNQPHYFYESASDGYYLDETCLAKESTESKFLTYEPVVQGLWTFSGSVNFITDKSGAFHIFDLNQHSDSYDNGKTWQGPFEGGVGGTICIEGKTAYTMTPLGGGGTAFKDDYRLALGTWDLAKKNSGFENTYYFSEMKLMKTLPYEEYKRYLFLRDFPDMTVIDSVRHFTTYNRMNNQNAHVILKNDGTWLVQMIKAPGFTGEFTNILYRKNGNLFLFCGDLNGIRYCEIEK